MLRSVSWILSVALGCSILAATPLQLSAQSARTATAPKVQKGKTADKTIDAEEEINFFEAIDQGKIKVDFIAKDATEANVTVRNESGKPIRLILPETFGAVPVLAQGQPLAGNGNGGGNGGLNGGGGMGGQGGMGQGMGGGMGGMMGGMGGGMMGGMGGMGGGMGGMFRVEPDKPRKLHVETVCLEHGKRDPTPRMKYKIVRLEEVNADAKVSELCKSLGYGKVNQNTAQAVAWHVANGLSWQELLSKPKVISRYTGVQVYFSSLEIQNAMRITNLINLSTESSSSESRSGAVGNAGASMNSVVPVTTGS